MAPSQVLQHNVQPLRPRQYGSDVSASDGGEFDDEIEASDAPSGDEISGHEEGGSNNDDEDVGLSEGDGGEDAQAQISSVSFGALKQAQDSLSRKRKRGSDSAPEQEDKLASLRDRLKELREKKALDAPKSKSKPEKSSKAAKMTSDATEERTARDGDAISAAGSDSDSAPSEEEAPSHSRSSKHAPASQSSRRQVTRKRNVIDVPKRAVRDPRFDAIHNQPIHQGNTEKAYSFLTDYQKSEIAELKAAMKKTKSENEKEELKRTVMAMENRLRSKEARDRQQAVLNKHRKEEKDRVQEGKNPYYLKRSEVKERALVDRYKGMKGKEREKAVDKKRKKEGQKEKKRMPSARRAAG
ncbi:hypothetical protein MBLNU230_g5765t1 [Neophaeotheca triangularis]